MAAPGTAMLIEVAVVKVAKYGVAAGGDTVEVAERPSGGLSAVLVDGQGSGAPAKAISSAVATKAAGLLSEGVRDGAAARALNDYLYASRRAQVQASLAILSADLAENVLRASRNTTCPALFLSPAGVELDADDAPVIGVRRLVRPSIRQVPLEAGTAVVSFTDGVLFAGRGRGRPLTLGAIADLLLSRRTAGAESMARALLDAALAADEGRPSDDMTVVVVASTASAGPPDVREMVVRVPVGPGWSGGS
jgi:serine phosphatase RsbU (regulator of sigma subunit)